MESLAGQVEQKSQRGLMEVRNPDQWIGGLTDSEGPCLRKGLCTAELGHV